MMQHVRPKIANFFAVVATTTPVSFRSKRRRLFRRRQDAEFDPPVSRAAGGRLVVRDRFVRTVSLRRHSFRIDPLADKVGDYRGRPLLREVLVVGGIARVVGVAADLGGAVAVVDRIGAAVGVLEAVGVLGLVGALVDLVGNAVLVAIGAAVELAFAPDHRRSALVRALVLAVGDRVVVAIGHVIG